MNNLKQFFDMQKLDDQQLGAVEFVLNSPAYEDTFKPYLLSIRENMNALWLDRSQQRKDAFPDDYLAGSVAAIDGLLKFFSVVIHETSMERMHATMSSSSVEEQYAQHQQSGGMQQAESEEYDPAEDY